MLIESARQDVVANNLANATTTGFKGTDATSVPFQDMLVRNLDGPGPIGTLSMGAELSALRVVDQQGPLRATGNPLDVALVGTGYLAVQTAAGERYTRDGNLQIDAAGRLATKGGEPILGEGGPIRLGPGEVKIAADGTVTQDGGVRGRIRIVALDPASMRTEGANTLAGTPAGAADARLRQNHLEASNVNVVGEMVELIRVMRSFEASQKAVQAHDEALQSAVTKVGQVG
jgi:flagellar basal-body rod protein FlgF